MSTTVADLRAIVGPLIAGAVYRDVAPDEAALTFVVLLDDIEDGPLLHGDGRALAWSRLVQVDVWQAAEDEDDSLVPSIVEALDGAALARAEGRLRCRVESSIRAPEPDLGLVHQAITVRAFYLR